MQEAEFPLTLRVTTGSCK